MVYLPNPPKTIIRKMVFRSAREKLYQETIAQTGELETHVRFLRGARLWLEAFWMGTAESATFTRIAGAHHGFENSVVRKTKKLGFVV